MRADRSSAAIYYATPQPVVRHLRCGLGEAAVDGHRPEAWRRWICIDSFPNDRSPVTNFYLQVT